MYCAQSNTSKMKLSPYGYDFASIYSHNVTLYPKKSSEHFLSAIFIRIPFLPHLMATWLLGGSLERSVLFNLAFALFK